MTRDRHDTLLPGQMESPEEDTDGAGDDVGLMSTLAPEELLAEIAAVVAHPDTLVTPETGRTEHALRTVLDEGEHRYQRAELLGEGGMGKVWLIRDDRIGRRVAQKVIRLENVDAEMRARFLREARVQGQLEHPSVVPVYDLGTGADGELFFTMKRVRGVTLRQVIDGLASGDAATSERFSQRRLLSVFSQICLAVDFVHARGVIHRDLKPENLMVGDHGETYVLDWGVARTMRDEVGDDPSTGEVLLAPTQTGIIGTPGYASPEQLRGSSALPTTDVFALGAILFELLALATFVEAGAVATLMTRTMTGVDVRQRLRALGRELPPELVLLVERATRVDPAQRIQTARELQAGIEAFLDGQRDQLLRRELADQHLASARKVLTGTSHALEAHRRALRETGRALALVPDHPEARELILSLFSSAPSEVPPEVQGTIEAARARQSRLTARGGALGMVSMLLFFPVLALLGVRSWLGVGIFGLMTIIAIVISSIAARREKRSAPLLYGAVLFNNVVFALCAGLYGPLVMVPTMVITNTVSFALHLDGRTRIWAIASACLAVALPFCLQIGGVLPASYVASGDGILLRPLWLALPPAWTGIFIATGTLIAIINGSRAVAQVRDELTVAERRLQMQRWQLQQLLPEDRAILRTTIPPR